MNIDSKEKKSSKAREWGINLGVGFAVIMLIVIVRDLFPIKGGEDALESLIENPIRPMLFVAFVSYMARRSWRKSKLKKLNRNLL